MPTTDEVISRLKVEIEELKESRVRWADRTMPAYQRIRQQIRDKQAYLDLLLSQRPAAHGSASSSKEKPKAQPKWYESPDDVLKRRQIVLRNPNLSAKSLCKLFDQVFIALPESWERKFNVTTWTDAYKDKKARTLIQKMISTDKKHAE